MKINLPFMIHLCCVPFKYSHFASSWKFTSSDSCFYLMKNPRWLLLLHVKGDLRTWWRAVNESTAVITLYVSSSYPSRLIFRIEGLGIVTPIGLHMKNLDAYRWHRCRVLSSNNTAHYPARRMQLEAKGGKIIMRFSSLYIYIYTHMWRLISINRNQRAFSKHI